MSTLLNPSHVAAYDPHRDRITLMLRDGRDVAVADLDPDELPGLIDALMAARCAAKKARKPVPLPPPIRRPEPMPAPGRTSFSLGAALEAAGVAPPDFAPIRRVRG
jgi:hypothetical protein